MPTFSLGTIRLYYFSSLSPGKFRFGVGGITYWSLVVVLMVLVTTELLSLDQQALLSFSTVTLKTRLSFPLLSSRLPLVPVFESSLLL